MTRNLSPSDLDKVLKKSWDRWLAFPSFPAIILGLICFVSYVATLHSGFKLDDFAYINPERYPQYQSWIEIFSTSLNHHYNPINYLLNYSLFQIFGQHVVPFHLLNMVLFYANIYLLYRMALVWTHSRETSLMAAVVFCLHPINAEIMNQIVFNTVLFAAMFSQLSFICYDRYLTFGRKTDGWATVFFALIAFFSLETSWILPWYLFCWTFWVKGKGFKESLGRVFPVGVCAGLLFIFWYFMSYGNSLEEGYILKIQYLQISPLQYLGSLSLLLMWYLSQLVIPYNHIWIYSLSPLAEKEALGWIGILTGFVLIVYLLRKKWRASRVFLFLGLWFVSGFCFLLPGSLAHPEAGLIIEPYWFYVSSFGFFVLLGLLLSKTMKRLPFQIAILIFVLILLGLFFGTQRMNQITRNERSYSEYWLSISENPVPLLALSSNAFESKDFPRALSLYQHYLNRYASSPYSAYSVKEVKVKLAIIYLHLGNLGRAHAMIQEALKIDDHFVSAYITQGLIYLKADTLDKAQSSFLQAAKLNPQNSLSRLNLVDIYSRKADDARTIAVLKELTALDIQDDTRRNVYARLAVLQYVHESFAASFETVEDLIQKDYSPEAFIALAENFMKYQLDEPARMILQQGLTVYPKANSLKLLYDKISEKEKKTISTDVE